VAAELGLVGLVPYLGLLLFTWLDYSRAWRTAYRYRARGDPELRQLHLYAVFLQIGLLASLIGNNFLSSFRYRETWILMAASAVLMELVRSRVAVLAPESSPRQAASDTLTLAPPRRGSQPAGG
jgi:O-antigen ligase